MHYLLKPVLSIIFLLAIQPTLAAEAEVVWTHFDGKQHQILFSAYSDDEWQQPGELVYSSSQPLATPVIGTLPSGDKLLIWSEMVRDKVKLMYSRSTSQSSTKADNKTTHRWAEADLFSDQGKENLGPSLVTDLNGHVWVFWSSSSTLPSDVYLSRFDGTDWSKEERIHAANQVPDNGVQASLNDNGNIYVEWNTFDFEINDYRLDSKTFITENPYPGNLNTTDTLNPADIPEPDFIGLGGRATIHFPKNKFTQNLVLKN